MEEMTREELEQEIAETEQRIGELQAELEDVQAQLNEAKEGEQPDEALVQELEAKEAALFEEITALQMKGVALKKRLDNLVSDETLETYNEEEG